MTYPPTSPSGSDCLAGSTGDRHTLRIIAVGSLAVVNHHILQMHQLGYAEPGEWSKPLPTANPNEVMRILTKRILGLSVKTVG